MEKIKWGVLGCAGIAAEQTIPAMQQAENAELYGIASRGLEKQRRFRSVLALRRLMTAMKRCWMIPGSGGLYPAAPTASMASGYGKRRRRESMCFVKKPLSGSAKDVEDIIRCCDEAGVVFMEAFAYLHSPIIQEIKKNGAERSDR